LLQQGHLPFCSLKSLSDNPLDNLPPLARANARLLWLYILQSSGLDLYHVSFLALYFSGFAEWSAELHLALSVLTFSMLLDLHAITLTFAHGLQSPLLYRSVLILHFGHNLIISILPNNN
jgi:hypothetical protein